MKTYILTDKTWFRGWMKLYNVYDATEGHAGEFLMAVPLHMLALLFHVPVMDVLNHFTACPHEVYTAATRPVDIGTHLIRIISIFPPEVA